MKILMRIKSNNVRLSGAIIILLLVAIIPLLIQSPYYLDLIIMAIVNAILAMTFIMLLRVGLINLSITAFWGMGAYISAILIVNFHFPFWTSLLITILLTGLIAWGLGFILIGQKITGFSFVILSAVIAMLFTSVVSNIQYLGAYNGFPNIPPPDPINLPFLPEIEFVSKVPFFYLILILFLLVITIYEALNASSIGRAWISTGADPKLAEATGVNTFRYKMLAFVLSSAIAGLAGSFYASYQGYIAPTTFGMWQNINIQVYAILGGVGYAVLGPIIGSGLMTFLTEVLRPISMIAPLITGALLIILILFLPQGLLGLVQYKTIIINKISNISRIPQKILSTLRTAKKFIS
ncbi:MAG: branched-chain amino acid ABC transporter permease [Dehalococcoidales bacterium]|nr:branched-chain amino acid ABC transporter permease [Dehalococcoidales bacterium]